jgi:hypothetical protein
MSSIAAPAPRVAVRAPASRGAVIIPVVATIAGEILATIAWMYGNQEIRGDARGYYDLAVQIAVNGPGSFASTFRTYGYPAFLALLIPFVGTDAETVRTSAFVVQLTLFLVAAWFGARRLSKALGMPDRWPWIYAVTVCNPFMLIHSIQMLTDVFSATLVYVATILSIPSETEAEARSAAARRTGWPWRTILVGVAVMLIGGLAVMVRPPNMLLIPVWLFAWLVRTVRYRQVPWRAWPILLAMVVLPFVPQSISNYRAYGIVHPFIVLDQYESNSSRAMRLAKYATINIAGIPAKMLYSNPFGPPEDVPPFQFLREEPLRFAATLAVRTFALFDQDLPFTYVNDLNPWYRWHLSIPNYLFLLAGFVGLCLPARAGTPEERSRYRRTIGMLALTSLTIWAMYMVTNVENRYSLPVYPLLAAPSVIAVLWLGRAVRGRPLLLALAVLGAAVWAYSMAQISLWIDRESPMLVATRAALAARPPSPTASYKVRLPADWEPGKQVTIPITVTNTGPDAWLLEGFFNVTLRTQILATNTAQHRALPKNARVYVNPTTSIGPGESADFLATVETPTVTGRYILTITMIRTGIDEPTPGFEESIRVDKGR